MDLFLIENDVQKKYIQFNWQINQIGVKTNCNNTLKLQRVMGYLKCSS